MTKHTAAPWHVRMPPPNGDQAIGAQNGMMVAIATTGVGMKEETLANARLIAAAPELLEALKLGLSACQSVSLNRSRKIDDGDGQFNYWQTGEWCEWLDGEVTQTLRAAIAKATGEQA